MPLTMLHSMDLDDEEKMDTICPIPMPDKPQYPYGLCICLTHAEFEKLGLDPSDALALSNAAEAHLRVGDWPAAATAADAALAVDAVHAKSLLRKARALRELERYAEAEALARHPALAGVAAAAELAAACAARRPEAEEGRYDWPSIINKALRVPESTFDVADFTHPALHVCEVADRGLGVKTAAPLATG